MSARTLLGKARTLGSRTTIYQTDDGLEIEINEQYEVTQKRVLYDDVLMVTIHRETGPGFVVITGLWSVFFILIGSVILSIDTDVWPVAAVFYAIALPGLIGFLQRVIFGIDVVTVFGRRSKTAMRFAWRKRRARQVYAGICATVARHQPSPLATGEGAEGDPPLSQPSPLARGEDTLLRVKQLSTVFFESE
ncbi:MAG TPA: hypothetical protein VGQ76_19190 [Thermoanaerobaculia bacterium]|jgi:hypothetical protein|nr:hypothetical protein [Thermoanaerobaculia bacterium]